MVLGYRRGQERDIRAHQTQIRAGPLHRTCCIERGLVHPAILEMVRLEGRSVASAALQPSQRCEGRQTPRAMNSQGAPPQN
jgi:hypothetical protein